jgi:hypothetical protein
MLRKRLLIPLLVALCLMLAAAGIAYADLKAVSVFYGWDEVPMAYANSLDQVTFDGRWVSLLHELSFDSDQWVSTNPAYPPYACPAYPTRTTKWAGVMEMGLAEVDNAPDGAPGFRESRNWQLVACDRNADGKFDNKDLAVQPETYMVPYSGGTLQVITKDLRAACSTGNCKYEIVTTIFINTDSDCDGFQNTDIPAGGVCFYAEGRTPVVAQNSPMLWQGNLQARISAGGGDKTVNFHVHGGPVTAVTLSSFTAKLADARSSPLASPAAVALVGVFAAAGAAAWRLRRVGW